MKETPIIAIATTPTLAAIDVFLAAELRLDEAAEALQHARRGVGRSIRRRRRALGLPGEALARIAGENASELSKLERGKLARGEGLARRIDAALSQIELERRGQPMFLGGTAPMRLKIARGGR